MKIKSGFVLEKVGGSYLACATGDVAGRFSGIVKMNDTGAFIWNKLVEGSELSELVECVASSYEVDAAIAEKDVTAFVENLKNNGILED